MKRAALIVLAAATVAPSTVAAQSPMDLDRLVRRGDVYVQPTTLEPHGGPVVRMWDQGVTRERGTLRSGRWHGVREVFYPSGRLASRETYTNGVLDGPAEAYFKNEQLSARENYREGRLDGPYESYWVRGAVAEQGAFVDGRPCGEWVSFGDAITYPPCPRSGG